MANSITKHIPNTITSLNVFSGCLASVMAFQGKIEIAVFFIFAAAIFDFLDGLSARLLKAYSLVGKELDSLADVISFGFAPASIMYFMLGKALGNPDSYFPYISFIIVVFSAIRLAKFNVDTRQTDSFIGLNVPSNALFISGLTFWYDTNIQWMNLLVNNHLFLFLATIVFSLLLVSEFPMFAFKITSLKFKENKIRYIFIALSLLLIISLKLSSIPFLIILYLILSAINNWIHKI